MSPWPLAETVANSVFFFSVSHLGTRALSLQSFRRTYFDSSARHIICKETSRLSNSEVAPAVVSLTYFVRQANNICQLYIIYKI